MGQSFPLPCIPSHEDMYTFRPEPEQEEPYAPVRMPVPPQSQKHSQRDQRMKVSPYGDGDAPLPPHQHAHFHRMRDNQEAAFDSKYEVLNVIGMGSTSQCRRVRERATRREFACKIIDKSKVSDAYSPLLEQYENEIEVLMKLQQIKQHANIIHLEDVYVTPTTIYMVMELMSGGELFDYVVERGTLSEEEASAMVRKVTSAVAHMHSQGIIHRDLKPENLLLTRVGPGAEIKIIDFGLSKMLPDVGLSTQSFLGTRGYLAPEMLKRQAYSASVDVWALGVISFILLCGCLPFDDDSAQISDETAAAKFRLRFPDWAQNISAEAKDFLAMLLSPEVGRRASATEALEHPWLRPPEERFGRNGTTSPARKSLLASPKHIRNVPRTPKGGNRPRDRSPIEPDSQYRSGTIGSNGVGGGVGGGGGGIGAAVTGNRQRAGSF